MNEYRSSVTGKTVELGSGMGSISEVISDCIRTDLFPYPWIDQVENAYHLSFEDTSISNLLMVDVFHHLRYPGNALQEFLRVLKPGGRVIMMEPGLSALGYLIYGLLHVEPIGMAKESSWFAPEGWKIENIDYYAAQGNATRIFVGKHFADYLSDWNVVKVKRLTALAYAASGGYSGPQLYPTAAYPFVKFIEKLLRPFPALFATRLLVVLEKINLVLVQKLTRLDSRLRQRLLAGRAVNHK
ncbi:MAG: class I SAM-dependent methyltransferase [Anaerolineales bacterium]|nr:class I SAM-dependent methyltransferase [Anaerolineales bacterium]